jgi:4-diphosphocytidyl-2-C-methyl-D-erythritol kinase
VVEDSLVTTVTAPAKLTLSLRVRGVRSDGYHLLDAEMVSIDLADQLTFAEGDGLVVTSEIGSVPGRSNPGGRPAGWPGLDVPTDDANLVVRALAAVGRRASVHLIKRIPPGAGLGGGSADAAAVLRWAGCTDTGVAAGLGADVPFCVAGGRARVGGIGEELEPLEFEARHFTLLLLPFGVATADVYRAWDALSAAGGGSSGEGTEPSSGEGGNDLEEAALRVEPRLGEWRALFGDLTGHRPRLAGSGSTWFVEGTPEDLGLTGRHQVDHEGMTGLLVGVRTTPAVA